MSRTARWIIAALSIVPALPAFCGDWNPRLAADYLDSRQKEWFAWPAAKAEGGTCFSCHTSMTYLLARPRLRGALGERQPMSYEDGLLAGLRTRLEKPGANDKHDDQGLGVESILAAFFLSRSEAASAGLSAEAESAFSRMWTLQIDSGKEKGSWHWFSLKRDPWEMPDSSYYGATIAALAVGSAPGGYAARADIREHVAALKTFLCDGRDAQPLHNRLMLLWASTRLAGILNDPARRALITEVLGKQQPDGGWTMQSLGPWQEHPGAPSARGSDAYATALAAFVLEEAGVPHGDPKLGQAIAWLKSHQDRQTGSWASISMNKAYEPGSMPLRFMDDAATAFATLALLDDRKE